MTDDQFPDAEETFDEPDETITYVQNIEFAYDDAEDVKVVRFEDGAKAIEVGITDEVMVEFLEVAEAVYDKIHIDMAELDSIVREAENEQEVRDRLDVQDPTDADEEDDG